MQLKFQLFVCFSLFSFLSACDFAAFKKQVEVAESVAPSNGFKYSVFHKNQKPVWRDWQNIEESQSPETIIEINLFSDSEQTPKQKAQADSLYKKTLDNIKEKKWYDVNEAAKAGYILGRNPSHALNPSFILDGHYLNPNRPEYLMFYNTSQGMVLAGVMFILDEPSEHGQQIGGPETVWHFHDYLEGVCYPIYDEVIKRKLVEKGYTDCSGGVFFHRSPEMLHIWFVEHPQGRFATSMSVDESLLLTGEFSNRVNELHFGTMEFDSNRNAHHH